MPQSIGGGAADALTQILQEQFLRAQEAQRIKEADRQAQLDRDRLTQNQSQFSQTLGLDQQRFGETQTQNAFGRNLQSADIALRGAKIGMDTGQNEADNAYRSDVLGLRREEMENDNEQSGLDRVSRERVAGMRQPAGGGGGGGTLGQPASEYAKMVASDPSNLQSLTPSGREEVLKEIANDPESRLQFHQQGLKSIRGRAQRMLGSLERLFAKNEQGKVSTVERVNEDGEIEQVPAALSTGGAKVTGSLTLPWARTLQGMATAAVSGGTVDEAADAGASYNNVVNNLIVDLIAEMKDQSRTGATGFGQLNRAELSVLESAATTLSSNLSEEAALEELGKIYVRLQKIMMDSPEEIRARQQMGVPGGVTMSGAAAPTPGAPASGNRVGRFEIVTE